MLKNEAAPLKTRIGISGLDEVLMGGINQNNIILLEGSPGAGKTTLGLEFIYRGAMELDEPGLIVSFELGPQKLMRDAAGFGWDFASLEKKKKVKIVYTSPSVILDELQSPDGVLAEQIREIGAKRLLLDGITPLQIFGDSLNGRPFRDSLHVLVESLQRYGVTAMLTREVATRNGDAGQNHGHERFVCDTIITLSAETKRRGIHRYLEVSKSRGQDFIGGQHTFRIEGGKGVQIYRRTQSRPKEFNQQATSSHRTSTGNPALDTMMGGGLYDGSVTLVVGISGTGKTVSGIQFLDQGVKDGKKGLLVTLDEHPQQLIRNAESLGFPLGDWVRDGKVRIHYDSPLELELDVHFEDIVRIVQEDQIERVVIDSLAAYEATSPEESGDFMYALATFFKNRLATAMFNYESPELLGVSQISEDLKASHLVDNIVLLNYVEISTRLRRAITVPKARGSKNLQRTREYVIDQGGISLLDEQSGEAGELEAVPQLPFSSYYGLLSWSPDRKSPIIEERVVSGESLPKSPKMEKQKPVRSNGAPSRREKGRRH